MTPSTSSCASSSKSPITSTSSIEGPNEEHCIICLQSVTDRTLLPACGHDYACFQCIVAWITTSSSNKDISNSRRCPLCNTPVGEYIVHGIRSEYDFERYWLPPLSYLEKPPNANPSRPIRREDLGRTIRARTRRDMEWGRRRKFRSDANDELEKAIERRRHIYRHDLYAKHVASNRHTKYRPCPSPSHIASSQDLCSRVLKFVRRELRIWEGLDVEFLTQYILSIVRTTDLRSEAAVKLLSNFLDSRDIWIPVPHLSSRETCSIMERDTRPHHHAEHFAHELYAYLRSPFADLTMWDRTVQYNEPTGSCNQTIPSTHFNSLPSAIAT